MQRIFYYCSNVPYIDIVLKIILNKIYKKLEGDINKTQIGFRQGFGTREAFLDIAQRCLHINEKSMPAHRY